MPEFFITARSFAAPFFSDESECYVEAETPEGALESYAASYKHPCGLYAAEVWTSADAYHKTPRKPLARWLSNHEIAKEAAMSAEGGHSYYGHGPGDFEVDRERVIVDDPKGGRVVAA